LSDEEKSWHVENSLPEVVVCAGDGIFPPAASRRLQGGIISRCEHL